MKKSFINIPKQGLMTDFDKSEVHQDRCVTSENLRFYDDEGDFVAHPFLGNEKVFELSQGFSYIGKIVKGNLSFIFSINSVGQCEVGSYPSPAQLVGFTDRDDAIIDTTKSGPEYVYKPLCNYKGKKRMRTSLFDFDNDKFVQGVARVIFDDTYNLYYTDKKNPLRVINSGFDTDFVISNDHDIDNSYFTSQINLIQNAARLNNDITSAIDVGGQLDYATYFLYLRYATSNLDVTDVVAELGPFKINKGSNYGISFSGGNTVETNKVSDKRITFTLNNVDESYDYIEVIVTKFTSNDTGALLHDTSLINKKYPASNGITISIYGNEETIPVLDDDVIDEIPVDDKADFILEHENRLWGLNWIRQNKHSSIIEEFALNVTSEISTDNISDPKDTYYKTNDPEVNKYYFPTEIYPFAIKAVLNNGTITYPYPITGKDFIDYPNSANAPTNSNGLVRFPQISKQQFMERSYNVYYIKFNLLSAISQMDQDKQLWITNNVKQFVIVQGERIKNIIGMGFGMPIRGAYPNMVYEARTLESPLCSYPYPRQTNTSIKDQLPVQRYWIKRNSDTNQIITINKEFRYVQAYRTEFEKNFVAVYLPDMLLKRNNNITQVGHCKMWYLNDDRTTDPTRTIPDTYIIDYIDYATGAPITDFDVEDFEIVGEDTANTPVNPSRKYRCVNQAFDSFTDPNPNTDGGAKPYSLFSYVKSEILQGGPDVWTEVISNRNLYSPKYILIKSDAIKDNSLSMGIYMLFKQDPENIIVSEAGQSENTIYYEKDIVKVHELVDDYEMRKGDMYFGVFSFKQTTWDPTQSTYWNGDANDHIEIGVELNASDDGTNGNYIKYMHGVMVNFPGFFESNIAYRVDDEVKTFYPKALEEVDQRTWALGPRSSYYTFDRIRKSGTTLESFLYNDVYSVDNSIRGMYGHDKVNNYDKKVIRAKTRMRYSIENRSGEISDSWRMFPSNGYQDFSQNYGAFIGGASVYGYLMSIQENAINRHYVNEKEVKVPSTSGELVIGRGSVLSDKVKVLAEYGIQSSRAFVSIFEMIVGYDSSKGIAWVVGIDQEGYRVQSKAIDITKQGFVSRLFEREIGNTSVVVSANTVSKEIWFSSWENDRTIVYDYRRNIISTVRTKTVACSLSPLDRFITSLNRNDFYQENNEDMILTYYGEQHYSKLGVAVNGMSKKENLSLADKTFEHVIVNGSNTVYSRMIFKTESQYSMLEPFYNSDKFWNNPRREGARWFVPVPKSVSDGKIYNENKEMRGTWMVVEIVVESVKNFFIKSLETVFNINR